MANALIFIFLLVVLTAIFNKVAEWFQKNKNINIIPAALIDMLAVIIFIYNYGSEYAKNILWMCVAIIIVLIIIVFNLIKYGLKNGVLASMAELVFSISAAFLIVCIIVAGSQKGKYKRKK